MSWFTPVPLTYGLTGDERHAMSFRLAGGSLAAPMAPLAASGASLGSASAASQWSWATPSTPAATASTSVTSREGACLRAPVELLSRMAQVASATGRSESDVWMEAAREWLLRRRGEPNPAPVAPAQAVASATPSRRSARVWGEIDALLVELRAPTRAPSANEGAPAA